MTSAVLSETEVKVATPLEADTEFPESVPAAPVVEQSEVSQALSEMVVEALVTVLPLASSIATIGCGLKAALGLADPPGWVVKAI